MLDAPSIIGTDTKNLGNIPTNYDDDELNPSTKSKSPNHIRASIIGTVSGNDNPIPEVCNLISIHPSLPLHIVIQKTSALSKASETRKKTGNFVLFSPPLTGDLWEHSSVLRHRFLLQFKLKTFLLRFIYYLLVSYSLSLLLCVTIISSFIKL